MQAGTESTGTGLTGYVAEFVAATRLDDIPDDVIALGKQSILDDLGLVLSGSVAKSRDLIRRHLGELGRPWTFAEPGVSIKPHPSGSLIRPGMSEMRRLIREHGIRAEDVAGVRVGTNSHMPNALIHHRPKNELQAKFSMAFCMAILLPEDRAGLGEFTDNVVPRDDVQAMIEKVEFLVDEEAERAGYHKKTTLIDAELMDRRRVAKRADFGKGSPADPMSDAEVADKLHECAAFARWPKDRTEDVVAMVRDLARLPAIGRLTEALARAAS